MLRYMISVIASVALIIPSGVGAQSIIEIERSSRSLDFGPEPSTSWTEFLDDSVAPVAAAPLAIADDCRGFWWTTSNVLMLLGGAGGAYFVGAWATGEDPSQAADRVMPLIRFTLMTGMATRLISYRLQDRSREAGNPCKEAN